jgi:hypothetical protein
MDPRPVWIKIAVVFSLYTLPWQYLCTNVGDKLYSTVPSASIWKRRHIKRFETLPISDAWMIANKAQPENSARAAHAVASCSGRVLFLKILSSTRRGIQAARLRKKTMGCRFVVRHRPLRPVGSRSTRSRRRVPAGGQSGSPAGDGIPSLSAVRIAPPSRSPRRSPSGRGRLPD